MHDRDQTKDQLIAELELLRSEVAALKQAELTPSPTQLQQTTPGAANLTIAPSLGLADRPDATGQYTILLVDDSEVDRATYRRFLLEDMAIEQADLFEQLQTELRERQQAELGLQETQEKLQLFIKYAPASIVMFDRKMCYLAASQRWVDEFRLDDLESVLGRSHYELFPNIPEQSKRFHERGLAGFIEKCDEDHFVHSDGSQEWFRWEIHPGIAAMAMSVASFSSLKILPIANKHKLPSNNSIPNSNNGY